MSAAFLSEKSVAEFFDTSTATVRRWVMKGVIPQPKNIGGLKRWSMDDLIDAVASQLDRAAGATANDADEAMRRVLNGPREGRPASSRRRHG